MYLCKVKINSIQIQVFCNLKKIELSISWALAPKEINYIYHLFTQTAVPMAQVVQQRYQAFILVGRGGGRLKNLIMVINLSTFQSHQHLGCLSHEPDLMTSNQLLQLSVIEHLDQQPESRADCQSLALRNITYKINHV